MAGGFHSLGLLPELLKAVDEQGWLLPTDVQDEAIPLILGGGDVMVASETGSGKTGSFVLPVLQCVSERLRNLANNGSKLPNSLSTAKMKDSICDVKVNENDRDALLMIDSDGYKAYSTADRIWVGGRCTHGVKKGKYYYEATLITPPNNTNISNPGVCRFGWSTMSAHYELGKDNYGFGYGGTAMKSNNNSFTTYGIKYSTPGIVIGCFLDRELKLISFSVNGVNQGKAFDIPESMNTSVLFPAFVFKGAGSVFNFGKEPFQFPPSSSSSSLLPQSSSSSSSLQESSSLQSSLSDDYHGMYQSTNTSHIISCNSTEAFQTNDSNSDINSSSNNYIHHPLAVIIEPSRELAEQVYQNVKELSCYLNNPIIQSVLLITNSNNTTNSNSNNNNNTSNQNDSKKIIQDLKTKGCDIIIGTLSKIVELVKAKIIEFSQIRFFILDEADRLTDGDNLRNILYLYDACPVGGTGENRLQVCFFSATLHSPAITHLSNKICVNPTWVDLKGIDSIPDTVHHVICNMNIPHQVEYLMNSKYESITDHVHGTELVKFVSSVLKKRKKSSSSIALPSSSSSSTETPQAILQYLFQKNNYHNGDDSINTSNNNNGDTIINNNSNSNHTNHTFDPKEVASQLIKALKQQLLLKIIDKFKMSQCMIFSRTNLDCDNLELFLNNIDNNNHDDDDDDDGHSNGGKKKYKKKSILNQNENTRERLYSCCVLGGMRSADERRRSLDAFKSGNVRFLLCTDIAARGIDVQGLPFVINMTLPDEAENYIHRIGRVGRADKMGLAISIVAPSSLNRSISSTIEDRFNHAYKNANNANNASNADNNANNANNNAYDSSNASVSDSSCMCCSDSMYCRLVSMNVDTSSGATTVSADVSGATTVSKDVSGATNTSIDIDKLLSNCKEKVWYHTCSNRGKNCTNRNLKSDGGCTVWYDEEKLLGAIKKRLHIEDDEYIPELSEIDFSLPSSLADLGIVYGEDSGELLRKQEESKSSGGASSATQMSARMSQLSSTVKELSHMEFESQNIFLNYQTKFI